MSHTSMTVVPSVQADNSRPTLPQTMRIYSIHDKLSKMVLLNRALLNRLLLKAVLLNRALLNRLGKPPGFPTETLVRHQHWRQCNQQPPSHHPPIYNVPFETLSIIFELAAPTQTRDGVYDLVGLTHVCRFWRVALINNRRAWSTIFATGRDRRSFVDMCLERSYPASLQVTVHAQPYWSRPVHPSCTCNEDERLRLVPNESEPCERHFVFESLAETKHSGRIHTLDLQLGAAMDGYSSGPGSLALGTCRFFKLHYIPLTGLTWRSFGSLDSPSLSLFFPPTLRSLSFQGSPGYKHLKNLSQLTSFTFEGRISRESLREIMLNNQSLETLLLDFIVLEGSSNQPPVTLPNLRSFCVYCPDDYSGDTLSTLFYVPALRRLSSLSFSVSQDYPNDDLFTLHGTGDDIEFIVKCGADEIVGAWQNYTGYAGPTIRQLRFENQKQARCGGVEGSVGMLFADVHTVEIGHGCTCFYHGFVPLCPRILDDLKELWPQLRTIRFKIPGREDACEGMMMGPFLEDYDPQGERLFDQIEELVVYRFKQKRPFSSVERMLISESEEIDREQELKWSRFYRGRRLDQYIQHE